MLLIDLPFCESMYSVVLSQATNFSKNEDKCRASADLASGSVNSVFVPSSHSLPPVLQGGIGCEPRIAAIEKQVHASPSFRMYIFSPAMGMLAGCKGISILVCRPPSLAAEGRSFTVGSGDVVRRQHYGLRKVRQSVIMPISWITDPRSKFPKKRCRRAMLCALASAKQIQRHLVLPAHHLQNGQEVEVVVRPLLVMLRLQRHHIGVCMLINVCVSCGGCPVGCSLILD